MLLLACVGDAKFEDGTDNMADYKKEAGDGEKKDNEKKDDEGKDDECKEDGGDEGGGDDAGGDDAAGDDAGGTAGATMLAEMVVMRVVMKAVMVAMPRFLQLAGRRRSRVKAVPRHTISSSQTATSEHQGFTFSRGWKLTPSSRCLL